MIQPIFSGTIAGLSHANPNIELVHAEDSVNLIREPHNQYDPNAIRVHHLLAGNLGYIPAESTLMVHAALANGLVPKAKIVGVTPEGRYPKVRMVVTVEI